MDLGLKDKNALVMSSSGGLGFGIAEALAKEGADVILTGRNDEKLKGCASRINAAKNGCADYISADLSDELWCAKIVKKIKKDLGTIDILIANTGGPPPGTIVGVDINIARRHLEMMLLRVAEITNFVILGMREKGWGRIVTVASSGIQQPIPNLALSNMIRSALVGWSKSVANEVANSGITCNILVPGRIHTNRVDIIDAANADKLGCSIEEVRQASFSTIPIGRYGTVEEFSSTAAFLSSCQASYITGSIIRCDGGIIKSV